MERSEHKSLAEFTLDILPREATYYFYILKCRDGQRYYGSTNNLSKRLRMHSEGHVVSTRKKRPVRLVYYEEFHSYQETLKREIQFKNGRTRKETIEKLIDSFPAAKCQGFNSYSDLARSNELAKSRAHWRRSSVG